MLGRLRAVARQYRPSRRTTGKTGPIEHASVFTPTAGQQCLARTHLTHPEPGPTKAREVDLPFGNPVSSPSLKSGQSMASNPPRGPPTAHLEGPPPFSFCSNSQDNIQLHQNRVEFCQLPPSSQLLFFSPFPFLYRTAEPETLSHPRPWTTPGIHFLSGLSHIHHFDACPAARYNRPTKGVDSIFPGP